MIKLINSNYKLMNKIFKFRIKIRNYWKLKKNQVNINI